jgi:hypothetical protein
MSLISIVLIVGALVIAVLGIFLMGLCKASAKGNIYCPSCESEDNISADIRGNRITRVCNTCGHKW